MIIANSCSRRFYSKRLANEETYKQFMINYIKGFSTPEHFSSFFIFFPPENGGDSSSRALNLSEKKTIKSEPEDSR